MIVDTRESVEPRRHVTVPGAGDAGAGGGTGRSVPEPLATRLPHDPSLLAAVSAGLWGMVGHPVCLDDLAWTRRLLGEAGPRMVTEALQTTGVLGGNPPSIQPQALAAVLATWAGATTAPLVCATVPAWLAPHMPAMPAIRDVLHNLIESATHEVLLCAPYMDVEGMGMLREALRAAAARGVRLTVLTHHLDDPQSPNARAVARLRSDIPAVEAVHIPTLLVTADGSPAPLLVHAKLLIVDQHTAWIGSANLTRAGLLSNLEFGVLLPDAGAFLGSGVRLAHLLRGEPAGGIVVAPRSLPAAPR